MDLVQPVEKEENRRIKGARRDWQSRIGPGWRTGDPRERARPSASGTSYT